MNILPRTATFKNPPTQFAGDVWGDMLVAPQDGDQRASMVRVRFSPGARSAWHSHARGQFLHVTQGIALFGTRDGTVVEVHPGETLYTPPGEEHWHAAAPDCFMEHLGVMEAGDDPETSVIWLEHITDEDYGGDRIRQ
jgi:quercetin dioxygenase-like cupin family protein